MEKFYIIIDLANILLAVLSVFMAAKLILRTEKTLDRAMKFFLGTALVLLLATLLQTNQYLGILSPNISLFIFQISRTLALLFFLGGLLDMLRMINEATKK